MGVPSEYDHPALAIFDRTLVNLKFVQAKQDIEYVFEFTQLVNSLLGILVHPWDQLLNKGKLESLKFDHPKVTEWGFRKLTSSRPHTGQTIRDTNADPDTLGALLRTLRNGVAHGNIDLLDLDALRRRNGWQAAKLGRNNDILGIEIWNCPTNSTVRTWGTVLTTRELKRMINGLQLLLQDREYWSRSAKDIARQRGRKMRLA